MPNYNGVWSLTTKLQYNTDWEADNVPPVFALFAGGNLSSGDTNAIQRVNLTSSGNGIDFADLSQAKDDGATGGNTTRFIYAGGSGSSNNLLEIDYLSYSSGGTAADFGDMTIGREGMNGAMASSTRTVFGPGLTSASYPSNYGNVIDYITTSSTGNATDFGDHTIGVNRPSFLSSSTRGVIGGGLNSDADLQNVMAYIEIGTTGNATDFGDLSVARSNLTSFASSTRGCFAGGAIQGGDSNTIDYITISSTGNASDFGDLSAGAGEALGAASDATTGLIAGGQFDGGSSRNNNIQNVTIASTGNTTDFGDLIAEVREIRGYSSAAPAVQG